MTDRYFIGLDLGQATDFTAVTVLEHRENEKADDGKPIYSVRHLQRFALGTPYTAIVASVASMTATPPVRGAPLVVDYTGVGRAVVDMLRRARLGGQVVPVTITAGHNATKSDDGDWHVPKKELVTCMQLLLQNRRMKIADGLPEAATLVRELQTFQVKITLAANETFGAWREGAHDDLVLATALAAWWDEKHPPWMGGGIGTGPSIVTQLMGVFDTSRAIEQLRPRGSARFSPNR